MGIYLPKKVIFIETASQYLICYERHFSTFSFVVEVMFNLGTFSQILATVIKIF